MRAGGSPSVGVSSRSQPSRPPLLHGAAEVDGRGRAPWRSRPLRRAGELGLRPVDRLDVVGGQLATDLGAEARRCRSPCCVAHNAMNRERERRVGEHRRGCRLDVVAERPRAASPPLRTASDAVVVDPLARGWWSSSPIRRRPGSAPTSSTYGRAGGGARSRCRRRRARAIGVEQARRVADRAAHAVLDAEAALGAQRAERDPALARLQSDQPAARGRDADRCRRRRRRGRSAPCRRRRRPPRHRSIRPACGRGSTGCASGPTPPARCTAGCRARGCWCARRSPTRPRGSRLTSVVSAVPTRARRPASALLPFVSGLAGVARAEVLRAGTAHHGTDRRAGRLPRRLRVPRRTSACTTALIAWSSRSIRSIAASSSSTGVTSPVATSAAWSVASIQRVSSASDPIADVLAPTATVPRRGRRLGRVEVRVGPAVLALDHAVERRSDAARHRAVQAGVRHHRRHRSTSG